MTQTPLEKYAKAIFHAIEQPKGMVLSCENALAEVADYAMSLEAESERLREEVDA